MSLAWSLAPCHRYAVRFVQPDHSLFSDFHRPAGGVEIQSDIYLPPPISETSSQPGSRGHCRYSRTGAHGLPPRSAKPAQVAIVAPPMGCPVTHDVDDVQPVWSTAAEWIMLTASPSRRCPDLTATGRDTDPPSVGTPDDTRPGLPKRRPRLRDLASPAAVPSGWVPRTPRGRNSAVKRAACSHGILIHAVGPFDT